MEIKVSDIPPEGITVELTEEAADFAGLGEDIKVLGPVRARFRLMKTGPTVYLSGEIEAGLELTCSRCGKPAPFKASTDIELDLNPAESVSGEEEKELSQEDLDVEFYKDDTVDLSWLLREQILLQAPMKPLCKEDCRGLCQFCGQDLNLAQCGCEAPAGHPGLAGLKDLLKDKK